LIATLAVMLVLAVATPEVKYLALGDSYTIGEAVDASARWPVQLARALREDGIAIAEPRIIATTGWTTGELSEAMDAAEPLGEWDFVSLLIGVNNQYRGRPVDEFAGEFEMLLRRAIALAGGRPGRVLVLTIPDWGVTPFGGRTGFDRGQIGRELDAYNARLAEISARHGVKVADIAPISRERGAELVAEDGLHPSAELYAAWTAVARPVARGLLR
jgi:lysophospholipase L1-like esterase